MVDLGVHAVALCAGQSQRCALFFGQKGAAARANRAQRALFGQAVLEIAVGVDSEEARVQAGLLVPKRFELGDHHGAVDVEVIALVKLGLAVRLQSLVLLVAGAYFLATLHALEQQLPNGSRLAFIQGAAHAANGAFQRTAVVVLLVGLAVALKASALVQVKECASELLRGQWLVQALRAQFVWVDLLQCFARRRVLRKEAVGDEQVHHAGFSA